MLTINPSKHRLFLQSQYGLYERTAKSKSNKATFSINDVQSFKPFTGSLSLPQTIQMHELIAKYTTKNGGIVNPELYARLINYGIMELVKEGTSSSLTVSDIGSSVVEMVKVHIAKRKNEKSKVYTIENYREFLDSAAQMQSISKGVGVPLIEIADPEYYARVEPAMALIRSHAETIVLMLSPTGYILNSERYFLSYFPFMQLTHIDAIQNLSSSYVLINLTPYPHNYVEQLAKQRAQDYFKSTNRAITLIVHKQNALDVVFKNPNNSVITIQTHLSPSKIQLGMKYIDNYKQFLLTSRQATRTYGLSRDSTVISVKSRQLFYVNRTAHAKVQLLLDELRDVTRKKVILVLIAGKGTGKSTFTKAFSIAVKLKYGIEVGVISSDAYGRWYHDVFGSGNQDEDKLVSAPTYTDAQYYSDNEDIKSIYEVISSQILMRAGVKDLNGYLRLPFAKKRRLTKEFELEFLKHLDNSLRYNERYFSEKVQTSEDAPRFLVVEAHATPLDAVAGRTNVTMQLDTIHDTTMAVIERDGTAEALLLHDSYHMLSASNHTIISPFELFYGFGLSLDTIE